MFYCKIGDISTTVAWLPPNKEGLKRWYKDWLKIPGTKNLDLYLVGNTAEILFGNSKDVTWDVDMVMIGKTENLNILKNILKQSVLLGWKHYMMIDITYNNRMFTWDPHTPITQTRYSRDFYKVTDKQIIKFKYKGQRIKKLKNGLETIIYDKAPGYDKWIERIKENKYLGLELNFKEIFPTSKRVVLLNCTKDKLTYKAKARDLYSASDNFREILYKAELDKPDHIFVISAKHGLVELDEDLEPYDFHIEMLNDDQKKEWSKKIIKDLKKSGINFDNDEFFPILTEEYLTPLKPYIKNIG